MNLFDADNLEATAELLELQWQFRASRALMTAHRLEIFESLREPKTASEVAAYCGTDVTMTEKLLIACCALGTLRNDGDHFSLTKLAEDVLLQESSRYMGGVFDHGESLWKASTELPEIVRTGNRRPARKRRGKAGSRWHDDWIWAMHGIASNGPGQWLAKQVDLGDRKLLLDVGGGPGTYSIVLCQRFSELRAVVWDVPETTAITRQVIERFDMRDRIAVVEGDWSRDEFGEGYDCLLMSNILHGPDSQAEMKLRKAMRALVPGGLFLAHDFLLDNDKNGPLPAALFNLMVGAYSVGEMIDVISSAGFTGASMVAYDEHRGSGIITAVCP